jgi:sugar phosphate isomerase/epimerase
MEIGLQLYTVRDYMADRKQLEETLGKVRATGYEIVQMGTPAYMNAREYKALLDGLGMKTCSSGGNYEKLLSDPSAIKYAAEQAHTLGTEFVTIGSIPEDMRRSKDGFKKFAEDMNTIGCELKKDQLKLSYHNHAFEFIKFDDCTGMDILTGETDRECVYFCVDTHWIHSGGKNPPDYIRSLKGRVTLVHFKDYTIDAQVDYVEQVNRHFAEVGRGNLDWLKIIDACRDSGTETVIVEQDICKGSPFDSIKISYDNLKKYGL